MLRSCTFGVLTIVLFAALLSLSVAPAGADQNARIWISPSEQAAAAPTFAVRVMQHADVGATGAQVSVSFDRTLLQVVDVAPGSAYAGASFLIGVSPQTKQDAIAEANNASGRLWGMATYFGPGTRSVPAGDAEFLVITMTPITGVTGSSQLQPTRGAMLDADYNDLGNIGLVSGRVAVGDVDGDGISGPADNCPFVANPGQGNADANLIDLTPPEAQDDTSLVNSDNAGDACDADADNDGLSNAFEAGDGPGGASHASCLGASANTNSLMLDSDGDRFADGAECALGTDPMSASSKPTTAQCAALLGVATTVDTDADGLKDYVEYCNYNSNPAKGESDGDGLPDGCEAASVDNNNSVNTTDVNLVAANMSATWGTINYRVDFDANRDGAINAADLAFISGRQSVCP